MIIALFTLPVVGAEKNNVVNIAVSEIPNLLSQSPKLAGSYNSLIDNLDGVNIMYMPPARAGLEFDNRDFIECLFPGSKTNLTNADEILQSEPISEVNAYLFYYPNQLTKPKIDDPNIHIAIRRGFSYGKIRLDIKASYTELNTDRETLQFLRSGRADAVIAYLSDMTGAAKTTSSPMPFYDSNAVLYSAPDAFICKSNYKTKQFIKRVNKQIIKFKTQATEN